MKNSTTEQSSKRGGIILLVILALILVLLYFASNWKSTISIKNIEIKGAELLSPDEIIDSIEKNLLIKKKNIAELNQKIKSNPLINNSYITHKNIEEIQIEIKEKKPIGILLETNNSKKLIDTAGSILPYHKFADTLKLPVISDLYYNNKLDTIKYNTAFEIIKQIREKRVKLFDTSQYNLSYNLTYKGFALTLPEHKIEIILGNEQNMSEKINNLIALLNSGVMLKNTSKTQVIDLRWENQVVIKNK